MGKKDKHNKHQRPGVPATASLPETPLISKRGWKIIGVGIGVLVLGYIVLAMTDPQGKNWASQLSPFLIIGGYAAIGVGIVVKDPTLP